MALRRAFPTILSDRLPETRDFFVGLLGFEVAFDSDYYVALTTTALPQLQVVLEVRVSTSDFNNTVDGFRSQGRPS